MALYKDLKKDLQSLKVGETKTESENIRSVKTMVSMINKEQEKYFYSTKTVEGKLVITKNRIKINKTKVLKDMPVGAVCQFDERDYNGLHSLTSKIRSENGSEFEVKKIVLVQKIS